MTRVAFGFTASELQTLDRYIRETVKQRRVVMTRSDLRGVASASVFSPLKYFLRTLALKVRTREGLVSVAEQLGFCINSGLGGRGLRGTGVWEFYRFAGRGEVGTPETCSCCLSCSDHYFRLKRNHLRTFSGPARPW